MNYRWFSIEQNFPQFQATVAILLGGKSIVLSHSHYLFVAVTFTINMDSEKEHTARVEKEMY